MLLPAVSLYWQSLKWQSACCAVCATPALGQLFKLAGNLLSFWEMCSGRETGTARATCASPNRTASKFTAASSCLKY